MDSFEFNKIAAAVLAALLLIFGTPTLLDVMKGGDGLRVPGFASTDLTARSREVMA